MKDDGASIAKELGKKRRQFTVLARRVQRKMDPDDLHDLRVLTRRMRAVVWITRHSRKGPGLKRLRKTLRVLGKALGSRRTLDVMTKDASRYGMASDSLKKDSIKAQKEVQSLLDVARLRELETLLQDAEQSLSVMGPSDFRAAIAELITRLEELHRLRPRRAREWHLFRIEVKKIRYASEILGLKASELKQLQDLLGQGHDLGVLMNRLGHKAKVSADMKRLWSGARRKAPQALKRAEQRLLTFRG
jgi:CHAD domain-containing protein